VAFFASETMSGKQPFWPDNLMKRHIRPVAKAIGHSQTKRWHTFRHTFGTLLKVNGEDVKTVQELLRHASSRITLEMYQQSVSEEKREAQDRVMGMLLATNEKDAEGSNPSAPLETYRNQLSKP
jgi:integrase